MRDFGSMQSPMNAYMLNLGLESLHVRMQRPVSYTHLDVYKRQEEELLKVRPFGTIFIVTKI